MRVVNTAQSGPPSASHSLSNICRHKPLNNNQVLNCPRCGADIYELRPRREGPMDAVPDLPELSREGNEHDALEMAEQVDKLKQLICSPNKHITKSGAPYPRTLRPVNDSPDEILTRVVEKMQAAIRHAGQGSADALLRSKLKGKYAFCRPLRPEHILKSVGGILYDQEWTGNLTQGMIPDHTTLDNTNSTIYSTSNYAFEMMLLVDYGFPPCPVRSPWFWFRRVFLDIPWTQFEHFSRFLTAVACRWNEGHLPDPAAWEYIARKMGMFYLRGLEVWDVATLIYYYYTRREPVDSESAKRGWTGYTGVLQEMVNEVPKRGTDRLARKLSLDINLLIPKFVSDREKRELMLCKARRLVHEYHLSTISDARTQEKGGWLESVDSLFSSDAVAEKENES
ncbi:uncharacterized protein B0H64DRAFT_56144 [Chaetomium fimeti]|uniref:Uncharacterized protein n=1 Tax=Chaetomium fimeti TaxID=1854472 RepID=A0AAE0H6D4_9PEZI|nr:hypothetical protein B0H64DRAFT_56144 [Chaetomium fimeti]